jgi:hypothetical protein
VTLGTADACSGGSAITFLNRNAFYRTTKPAKTLCNVGVTPTNPIDSQVRSVIGTAVQGVSLGGGNYKAGGIQILDTTLDYYFKVENMTATPCTVTMNIQIYETDLDPEHGF